MKLGESLVCVACALGILLAASVASAKEYPCTDDWMVKTVARHVKTAWAKPDPYPTSDPFWVMKKTVELATKRSSNAQETTTRVNHSYLYSVKDRFSIKATEYDGKTDVDVNVCIYTYTDKPTDIHPDVITFEKGRVIKLKKGKKGKPVTESFYKLPQRRGERRVVLVVVSPGWVGQAYYEIDARH